VPFHLRPSKQAIICRHHPSQNHSRETISQGQQGRESKK
jgi:hypothetical protein